ncbi:hypothetical protein B0H15DRAFT_802992 [Mycena belliarum]|uniref:Uncharacterized protein n=1 Tax=Mycena belliarum TaxID=1033014 RepID=A0AAD6TZB0_9AGAR|nr:hypothetical protein B0H15DRAFT_802992 [Mycena belliae]
MRFSFAIFVVAATFTSAAIIPRSIGSRPSGSDEGSSVGEGRRRAHAREFFLSPDDVDIPQRRSDSAPARRHARDFARRDSEPLDLAASANSSGTPGRRHPRDFYRRPEASRSDAVVPNTPGPLPPGSGQDGIAVNGKITFWRRRETKVPGLRDRSP